MHSVYNYFVQFLLIELSLIPLNLSIKEEPATRRYSLKKCSFFLVDPHNFIDFLVLKKQFKLSGQ